jgi:hypothetical protein
MLGSGRSLDKNFNGFQNKIMMSGELSLSIWLSIGRTFDLEMNRKQPANKSPCIVACPSLSFMPSK